LVIKTLHPDPDWIRIGIQPKMLDEWLIWRDGWLIREIDSKVRGMDSRVTGMSLLIRRMDS